MKKYIRLLRSMFSKKASNNAGNDTVRDVLVGRIFPVIDEYADWEAENGLYLPPGYETDPSGWNEVLRSIQRAFRLLDDELKGDGELWEAKQAWKKYGEQDTEKIHELNQEIQRGFELFGRYLFHLTDKKI